MNNLLMKDHFCGSEQSSRFAILKETSLSTLGSFNWFGIEPTIDGPVIGIIGCLVEYVGADTNGIDKSSMTNEEQGCGWQFAMTNNDGDQLA